MITWITNSLTILALAAGTTSLSLAQQPAVPAQLPARQPVRTIVVSLEDRKLALLEDGQIKKIYTVAVGKPSTPCPEGSFTIERRVANPVYQHYGRTVQPGPANPVGTRWMGLSIPGYGIHGTNEPKSIGKAASHGCIRMARADLEELYPLVSVGDQVQIIGRRNEETARLFEPTLPAPAQPVQAAAQTAQAQPEAVAPALWLASVLAAAGSL